MNKIKKEVIRTNDLREIFKEIFQTELEQLPEHLKTLEPKERIELLCKLIPFVFPKVKNVHLTQGEPW